MNLYLIAFLTVAFVALVVMGYMPLPVGSPDRLPIVGISYDPWEGEADIVVGATHFGNAYVLRNGRDRYQQACEYIFTLDLNEDAKSTLLVEAWRADVACTYLNKRIDDERAHVALGAEAADLIQLNALIKSEAQRSSLTPVLLTEAMCA